MIGFSSTIRQGAMHGLVSRRQCRDRLCSTRSCGISPPTTTGCRPRGTYASRCSHRRRCSGSCYRCTKTTPGRPLFAEHLVDLDEGLQEWRYRHVKMVERTIGDKTGTGGSSGAAYLRTTLFRPLFPISGPCAASSEGG